MNEAMQHINELMEFAKGIAPEVWAIYVRQQVMIGWSQVIVYLMSTIPPLIAALWVFWCQRRRPYWNKSNGNDYPMPKSFAAVVIGGVILGMLLTLDCFAEGCLHIMNPEYYAIQRMMP